MPFGVELPNFPFEYGDTMPNLVAMIQAQGVTRLLSLLCFVDVVITLLYFLMILGIGFYLKRYTKTGEDFFLAGLHLQDAVCFGLIEIATW